MHRRTFVAVAAALLAGAGTGCLEEPSRTFYGDRNVTFERIPGSDASERATVSGTDDPRTVRIAGVTPGAAGERPTVSVYATPGAPDRAIVEVRSTGDTDSAHTHYRYGGTVRFRSRPTLIKLFHVRDGRATETSVARFGEN
jgi:hypothetical protein